jgi:PleD family two-component response regulator
MTEEGFAIAVPCPVARPTTSVQKEAVMSRKRVLSVGQCAADHAALRWALRPHFDTEIVSAATADAALHELRRGAYSLVLVNRVLDAEGTPGVDLIRRIRAEEGLPAVPVMLVSNYEDAQEEAVGVGAVPGFGKGRLNDPRTAEQLRPYLA